ncbi:hypothetical protein [Terrihabitans soli]|nr:hypothetical protein [Terrihabitans soli]
MSEPLSNSTPEEVLPYAPKWASQSGYRNQQPNVAYDVFSEQENPSYRSMAELFSPQAAQTKKKSSHTTKMLMRFGAVVGIAGGALALFVGYIATQPSGTENGSRFKSVTSAVATVQAALAPSSAPQQHVDRAPPPVVAAPEPVAPPPVAAAPIVAPPVKAAPAADVASDRGAAPLPPPAAPAPIQAAPVVPEAPKQVATLSIQPLAEPAPVVPQLTAGELTTLMARGRRFVESGDFSSARPVYRRAAEAGYAEAALALGETYDPRALQQRGAVGMNGDLVQARKWYEKAKELGSLEAPTRLERLPRN